MTFLVALPVVCWLLLLAAFCGRGIEVRKSFLAASIVWGMLVCLLTEVLSTGHRFNRLWLSVGWGLAILLTAVICCFVGTERPAFPKLRCSARFMLAVAGVAIIVVVTGIIAVVAPPNNWDSMTYHMSRVVHWMQNESVAHYPTHLTRQLHNPPWAEFAIAHLQILSDNDYFANLVQWFAMLGCVLGVTLIARDLGASPRAQLFAAVLTATLPMGILQASSTQNDYVVAFWLVCLVHFGIAFRRQADVWNTTALAGSLGLALLTKGTAYIYAAPFMIWFAVSAIKTYRVRALYPAALIGLFVLALNGPHYFRNYQLWGSPIQADTGAYGYPNKGISLGTVFSNVTRNLALHTGTRSLRTNARQTSLIVWAHQALGIDANDRKTTFGNETFEVPKVNLHEDGAGNPLHIVLLGLALLVLICGWRKMQAQAPVPFEVDNSPPLPRYSGGEGRGEGVEPRKVAEFYPGSLVLRSPSPQPSPPEYRGRGGQKRESCQIQAALGPYFIGVVAACLFFCAYLRWQPWHSRLHLPLFVLWSPLIAVALADVAVNFSRLSNPWLIRGLTALLLIGSAPWLLLNQSRPVIGTKGRPSIFRTDRLEQYFANCPAKRDRYFEAARQLQTSGCDQVGLILAIDDWEYPLWALIRNLGDRRPRIGHVQVRNRSAVLAPEIAEPCALFTPSAASD